MIGDLYFLGGLTGTWVKCANDEDSLRILRPYVGEDIFMVLNERRKCPETFRTQVEIWFLRYQEAAWMDEDFLLSECFELTPQSADQLYFGNDHEG